jgi:hypothetical protein
MKNDKIIIETTDPGLVSIRGTTRGYYNALQFLFQRLSVPATPNVIEELSRKINGIVDDAFDLGYRMGVKSEGIKDAQKDISPESVTLPDWSIAPEQIDRQYSINVREFGSPYYEKTVLLNMNVAQAKKIRQAIDNSIKNSEHLGDNGAAGIFICAGSAGDWDVLK